MEPSDLTTIRGFINAKAAYMIRFEAVTIHAQMAKLKVLCSHLPRITTPDLF